MKGVGYETLCTACFFIYNNLYKQNTGTDNCLAAARNWGREGRDWLQKAGRDLGGGEWKVLCVLNLQWLHNSLWCAKMNCTWMALHFRFFWPHNGVKDTHIQYEVFFKIGNLISSQAGEMTSFSRYWAASNELKYLVNNMIIRDINFYSV